MNRKHNQQNRYQFVKKWRCECSSLYKTDASVIKGSEKDFFSQRIVIEERFVQERVGAFSKTFKSLLFEISPTFKNTVVKNEDIS